MCVLPGKGQDDRSIMTLAHPVRITHGSAVPHPVRGCAHHLDQVGAFHCEASRQAAEERTTKAEGHLADLYRRLQDTAGPDGSWPGADAAEIVRQVLVKAGYDCE